MKIIKNILTSTFASFALLACDVESSAEYTNQSLQGSYKVDARAIVEAVMADNNDGNAQMIANMVGNIRPSVTFTADSLLMLDFGAANTIVKNFMGDGKIPQLRYRIVADSILWIGKDNELKEIGVIREVNPEEVTIALFTDGGEREVYLQRK